MRKNGWRFMGLLLCIVLVCTACGGTSDGDTDTTATTTTTIPTTTTTRTPTTTQKAQAVSGLLTNAPDGKAFDPELLSRLSAVCREHKNEVSFYYKDLKTGYSIEFRADEIYQTASVIKAPYVKYLLESGVDLTKKLKSSNKQGYSYIDKYPEGTEFTVKELMEYAVRYSDNTAYYVLNKEFGFNGFNAYAKKLNIRANAERNLVLQFSKPRFGYLSARDAGLYFEDIAHYIEGNDERQKLLKEWLTTTTVDGMLADALGKTYTLAHKYGQQDLGYAAGRAYHDAAIVYSPHPYVLTILSTMKADAAADKVFKDIALLVDSIQTQMVQG